MGGEAFKHPSVKDKVRRIKREEIQATLSYVSSVLQNMNPLYTLDYLSKATMGSAGKQADSGDLDIVVDSNLFVGKPLHELNMFLRKFFGDNRVRSEGLKAKQLNTLWPINGDDANGLIQIDFIYGDFDYLHFTHYSPGTEVSPFKGVWISTAMGVLAKMNVLFEHTDPNSGERVAKISWAYDLERGLFLRTRMQTTPGDNIRPLDHDVFETKFGMKYPNVKYPRTPRLGYLQNPQDILRILLGEGVTLEDVNTFEKLYWLVKSKFTRENWMQFAGRVKDAVKRSSAVASSNKDQVDVLLHALDPETKMIDDITKGELN